MWPGGYGAEGNQLALPLPCFQSSLKPPSLPSRASHLTSLRALLPFITYVALTSRTETHSLSSATDRADPQSSFSLSFSSPH